MEKRKKTEQTIIVGLEKGHIMHGKETQDIAGQDRWEQHVLTINAQRHINHLGHLSLNRLWLPLPCEMIYRRLWFFGLASVHSFCLLKPSVFLSDFSPPLHFCFPPSLSLTSYPSYSQRSSVNVLFRTIVLSLYICLFFSLRSKHEATPGTGKQCKTPPATKPVKNWPKITPTEQNRTRQKIIMYWFRS